VSEAYLDTPIATPAAVRPAWYRSIGAFLFWLVLHFLPLIPRNYMQVAAGGELVPILPPLGALAFDLALAAAFVWWFGGRRDAEAEYRRATFRINPIASAVLGRLALVAVPLVATVILSLVIVPRFIPIPVEKANPLDAYLKRPFGVVAVLSMVSLVAPLLEEFLFRGWLQSRLLRMVSPAAAIFGSSIVFSLVHFQTFGFASRMIFALTAGYLAWSTRSIWPGVVLHGLYNAVLVGGGEATPGIDDAVLTRWAHTPAIFFPAVLAFAVSSLLLVAGLRVVARTANAAPPPAAG
jgi:membrane protease YdiL (CAAX protease family)